MDLPLYFPSDCNRLRAGFGDAYRKKFKVVFQDFGRAGHVNVSFGDNQSSSDNEKPVYTAQRQHGKQKNRARLCASCPTLPLTSSPVAVPYPFHSPSFDYLVDLPNCASRFSICLKRVTASFNQGVSWTKKVLKTKGSLDQVLQSDKISDSQLQSIHQNLPASIRRLTDTYEGLSSFTSFTAYNGRYSGGLLSCISEGQGEETRHLLFHARGQHLTSLVLMLVTPNDSQPLLDSELLAQVTLAPMFQVHAVSVQGEAWVAARHETSCSFFTVSKVEGKIVGLTAAGTMHCEDGVTLTSICLSPYLPGEALLCTDQRKIHIWKVDSGMLKTLERYPRFECCDPWLHAYYAGHPRKIVVVDRTAVRMIDHRNDFSTSVDLFALPSMLVQQKDRIMDAHAVGNGSPLHLVACTHSLFVVDQRFGGTPVMQWYPDLKGPLQYLACADFLTVDGRTSSVVLTGSQHPAEVMCYPFNHGGGCAVTTSLHPWRLSMMTDMADVERYKCFLGQADPSLFLQRVSKFLCGIAVAPGSSSESLVTYQLDCFGEIYFQKYGTPYDCRTARKAGVPATGEREPYVAKTVQTHVQAWVAKLQQQKDNMQLEAVGGEEGEEYRTIPLCQAWAFSQESVENNGIPDIGRRCSLCKDSIGSESVRSYSNNNLQGLCTSCLEIQHNISSSQEAMKSGEDFWDGGEDGNDSGLRCLNKMLPSLDSYEDNAFTSIHMELMKPEPDPLPMVKLREEHISHLVEGRKIEKQAVRKRKREKSQKQDAECADGSWEDNDSQPRKHSVFNSEEHQQQNQLIQSIMSQNVDFGSKDDTDQRSHAGAGSQDETDEQESGTETSERDGLDGDADLFDDSQAVDMPYFMSMSQNDDDDFF